MQVFALSIVTLLFLYLANDNEPFAFALLVFA